MPRPQPASGTVACPACGTTLTWQSHATEPTTSLFALRCGGCAQLVSFQVDAANRVTQLAV